ncbi:MULTISPECIES: outer membrane protein assembly factor BamD [Prosthecochloris]|uniref:Outer membrane protein assembly factor BamD n=1 Tax=Prosthecochloris vibrioformis TaxID=1098 RepID=A0A5C4S2Y4_PROVB|nr:MULTISPECIES: outer membrane protein assembly factor BamD [Prosthecochloris]ANT65965.1 outer membrane assembly lipoprotein YfiO [Prosthecochloris sp. CIB 2401]TNJ37695.1 outer membrane protein assembly factor BamD [Prosthecochloris vibrioformis]
MISVSFRMTARFLVCVTGCAGIVLSTGCSSVSSTASGDITTRFDRAAGLYQDAKYDRAALELESLMFEARATSLEDDVLFTLAETYYESEQYLLAVEIFLRLLEETPGSPYAEEAQFMLARSHDQLSPVFSRDQDHTWKAIREYRLYMDLYPVRKDRAELEADREMFSGLLHLDPANSNYTVALKDVERQMQRLEKVEQSSARIASLREKLARGSFSVAGQYMKLKQYRAAEVFYDEVMQSFADTDYFEQAWRGKIGALVELGKWFEALAVLEAYDQRFPENMDRVAAYREQIMRHFSNS